MRGRERAMRLVVGGRPVRGLRPVVDRGYSPAGRWLLDLGDGRSAFAKVGVDEATSAWLRAERDAYEGLGGATFLPEVLAWDDDGVAPVLVLEDLSGCRWPPPWRSEDVDVVLAALTAVASSPPWPSMLRAPGRLWASWEAVAEDPRPFLGLGVASAAWLDACLPDLLEATRGVQVEGDALQHLDVRSDNLCLTPDGRAVLIDWNHARAAAPTWDVTCWLPSLHAEGGPSPEEVVGDRLAGEAADLAGYFASQAGLPGHADAPLVRTVQRAQLCTALPWAARRLGLPPPDLLA